MRLILPPINLKQWLAANKDLFKPPVRNQCLYPDGDFMVMVVAGPNQRRDYHINQGEEIFYQIEGDMTLKVMQDGKPHDIIIHQGDLFLLPSAVPHSPQRPAHTIGLVIEKKRQPDEVDGFQWYCEKCNHKLYEAFVHVSDIVQQLPQVFAKVNAQPESLHCKACGHVNKP